jgi:DNA-binding Lrp family transcriptional regulator
MPVKKLSSERLIAALANAPTSSVADMAKDLGVSEPTIRRHLARLAESGAVARKTIVAPARLGIKIQMVFLIQVESKHLMAVAEAFAHMPAVHYVSIAASNFDLVIGAYFRSEAHLLDFLVHELGQQEGIRSAEKIQTLRVLKAAFGAVPYARAEAGRPRLPAAESRSLATILPENGTPDEPASDAIDDAIVGMIAYGEQPSTREIARTLGLSESAITRRLAKLMAAGAIAEHTILHPEQLGFPLAVHFLFRVDPRRLEATIRDLVALPELTYVTLIAGESDLAATGHFRSDQHLVAFLTEALGKIPGIERRRVSPFLKTLKTLYGGIPILPGDAWVASPPGADAAGSPAGAVSGFAGHPPNRKGEGYPLAGRGSD